MPSAIGRERTVHCFPFRSLIGAGVTVVDAPTEPANPMIGISAAVRHPTMNLDERILLQSTHRNSS
jgi:predicted amidohydrolase YtcJ